MIINYTNSQDKYFAHFIAEECGDDIIDVSQKIKDGDTSSIFSEKPYVLVADYNLLCKLNSIITMGKTKFEGSKIFYIVFVNKNAQKNAYVTSTFAKNISSTKKLVLFGCEAVEVKKSKEQITEADIINARRLGSLVRDSIPFSVKECSDNYPIRINS